MYCVVASCSKNSTARAGQSVTSRASCSSISAVPLRRRIGDGVGDLGARRRDARRHAVQRPVADQVADVGRHPVGAGLDELVVVELLEVLLERLELARDQRRAARAAARPAARRGCGRPPAAGRRGGRRRGSWHLLQPIEAVRVRASAARPPARTPPPRACARRAAAPGATAVCAAARCRRRGSRGRPRPRRGTACATAITSDCCTGWPQRARLEREVRAQRRFDRREHRLGSRRPDRA